jgi:hypothetical protein
MTTVEYDEFDDTFYAKCHDCPWTGRSYMARRDAALEGDRHDEWHADND